MLKRVALAAIAGAAVGGHALGEDVSFEEGFYTIEDVFALDTFNGSHAPQWQTIGTGVATLTDGPERLTLGITGDAGIRWSFDRVPKAALYARFAPTYAAGETGVLRFDMLDAGVVKSSTIIDAGRGVVEFIDQAGRSHDVVDDVNERIGEDVSLAMLASDLESPIAGVDCICYDYRDRMLHFWMRLPQASWLPDFDEVQITATGFASPVSITLDDFAVGLRGTMVPTPGSGAVLGVVLLAGVRRRR